ncbi:MAG: ThiF family adenylyltransferase [Kiritimatiellae bacterium]|nr:ThiF family adenylyltransferase [Kiritimatiellia bacterium]
MNVLAYPLAMFEAILRRLMREPAGVLFLPVGQCRDSDVQLLGTANPQATGLLAVSRSAGRLAPSRAGVDTAAAALVVGTEHLSGQAWGLLRRETGQPQPLHLLSLQGPGMHRIVLHPTPALRSDPHPGPRHAAGTERWSRTIGALGEQAWRRLTDLAYAVVGCGRTGAAVASGLACLGVRSLLLLDPDSLELHNLGEMAVAPECTGRPKAEILAEQLRVLSPPTTLHALTCSVTHRLALRAIRNTDFLFSCVDHDAARLAVGVLAALYVKPLIDIATGIHGAGPERRMGADIRLVLPGERCLLCLGGLTDEPDARRILRSQREEIRFYAARDWSDERAGSLASLNHTAASLAQRMAEDLVAERIQHSTWLHLEFDAAGVLTASYPDRLTQETPRAACPHCARFQGLGDEGLPLVRSFFSAGQEGPRPDPEPAHAT